MASLRTFIALPTERNVQLTITEIQTKLKETQAEVKWDLPDKFHITLKFLGNIEMTKIALLSASLAKSIKQFSTFSIQYNSVGAFPNIHAPRVVWIGIQENKIIQALQFEVENACANYGFPKEERGFHPHITLGRVKGNRNLSRLTDAIKTITFEPIESHCSEVLLMKSDLKPGGSVYTILKSFQLNK